MERKAYEVIIEDGKFLYEETGKFLHTTGDAEWIFVLSTSKILYTGKEEKDTFQHSSFLAGGATIAAGSLVVENGILKAVWSRSGCNRPAEENFVDFISFLKENNLDLTDVQMTVGGSAGFKDRGGEAMKSLIVEQSLSFFDIEKHESAISRWSLAITRAVKVGKGLSKNHKARKMALEHWLEAIDPGHRYGHNLYFYCIKWHLSNSREPFFYWLDVGEGKELNFDGCPRLKLQQQCIKYLGPMERKAYEVIIEDGKFLYKETGVFLHTTGAAEWIFVLSTSKILYAGKKKKGTFQHSSFLAGGATIAAGRLVVENGILKAAWTQSGHYRPPLENFIDFISFLKENNVDLTDVQVEDFVWKSS